MNLFLTGEFKQCKTGKRVLEDYLKNYNQFNQGLGSDSDSLRGYRGSFKGCKLH